MDLAKLKDYKCGCSLTCRWSSDNEISDIYMMMANPNDERDVPLIINRSHPRQKLVYFTMEVVNRYGLFNPYSRGFDWIASHNLNSDIPVTYAESHYHPNFNRYPNVSKSKKYIALLLISDCRGERLGYVKELMKYMPIISLGRCMNNQKNEIPTDLKICMNSSSDPWWLTKRCLMSKFYFYLAFENTKAIDYVTEKYFMTVDLPVIPVYYGAENINDFFPGIHAGIIANDFTPKALAEYLLYLVNSPKIYNKYFDWKSRRILSETFQYAMRHNMDTMFCNVCLKYKFDNQVDPDTEIARTLHTEQLTRAKSKNIYTKSRENTV